MKFLCPQCKAKYQIADEKIEGRTLRMKCRRCEHEIVVRGDMPAAPPSDAPPAPAKQGAAPKPAAQAAARKPAGATIGAQPQPAAARKPAGSALGADFRRQAAGGLADAGRSIPPTPLDAWHVAIHDVPVGPMKRDEVARKIAAGAVTPDSLVWREGMDDWRPLREVAELAPLLRRPSQPPAPAKVPVGGRLPPPGARPGPAAARPAPSTGRPGLAGARPGSAAGRPGAAAVRGNVVSIGGRLGAAAAPALDEEEFEQDEPTRIAASPFEGAEPPAASVTEAAAPAAASAPAQPPASAPSAATFAAPAPAEIASAPAQAPLTPAPEPLPHSADSLAPPARTRRKKPMPIGAWVAIAGAGAFGITLAAMVGARMLQAPPTQVAAVAPAPAETPTLAPPTAAVDVPGPGELPAGPATPETDPPAAAVAADNGAASGRPAGGGGTKRGSGGAAAPGGGTKQLSDADRALLEQMGGGGPTPSASLQNLARTAGQGADTGGPQLPELSAEMLRSTLTRNRQSLQSCYELAARQTGSTDTMRVDVSIVVGGSGTVTRVTADGNGPPQLNSCIQTAVRRWRFPGSGEATFPLVFSPGAR